MQEFQRTGIECIDTDIIVLVLHFIHRLSGEVWLKKGKKFSPVHDIVLDPDVGKNIINVHALTCCDTTKKSVWKVFTRCLNLLNCISSDNINEEDSAEIETFISKMSGCDAKKTTVCPCKEGSVTPT